MQRAFAGCTTLIAAGLPGGGTAAQPYAASRSLLREGAPSSTAEGAALARAVHQVIDLPRVFDDPYALPILGPLAAGRLQSAIDRGGAGMRASIVMRSRYAEDRLAAAVARGVRQYVLLGAGLDTFSCRNPHAAAGLRVFEVDHPATQRAKRERLARAGLTPVAGTTFVPVDFETDSPRTALTAAGLRFDQPVFFSLLGVVIYLTHEATMETMRLVAGCAPGSGIAFSFSVPDDLLNDPQRASRRRAMDRLAAVGEPWINFYPPDRLAGALLGLGFATAEPFSPADANRTYFAGRTDNLRIATGYMMSARV